MAVNPEYAAILGTDPKLRVWYEFHSRVLLNEISDQANKQEMDNIIHGCVRALGGFGRDLSLPRVHWITHAQNVLNITGQPFPIPTMFFTHENMNVFHIIAGQSLGGSLLLPIEIASKGRLSAEDSTDSRLVLLPHPSIEAHIPHTERSQHEFTHVIDPLLYMRIRDQKILNELVAIIGSYSDTDARNAGITLFPPYIAPYLKQQFRIEGVNPSESDIVNGSIVINSLVYNMTHTVPKLPNEVVTRRVMACRSLDDLKRNWPEVFPDQSGSNTWRINPRPRQR